jgi:tungstate transport system ATP-binding protein
VSKPVDLLRVRGLVAVRGGAVVLDIPELTVGEGEILALVGPNGAGKTTLLLCLAALTDHEQGEILCRGEPVPAGAAGVAYRRRTAAVFQEPLLLDTTVFRNVAAGLSLRGVGREETRLRVGESLERFGIAHLADRSARKLSGGEAQRASLARAFAVSPEILFLDEPLAALDQPTREAILEDLAANLRRTGVTAVLATHDRMEALRLADRMAVLRGGSVAQIGTPEEVMNRPASEFVASFVGMETLLSGRVSWVGAGTFMAVVNGVEVEAVGEALPGEEVRLGIRPEHVTLSLAAPEGSSARNRFRAKVERIVPQGPVRKVHLDCGFPLAAFVTQRSLEDLGLAPGLTVSAACKATAIHLIRHAGSK